MLQVLASYVSYIILLRYQNNPVKDVLCHYSHFTEGIETNGI